MTVMAKVTARKDGVDGFTVPFKVHQPNENAVPILVPITAEEFVSRTATPDRISLATVGAALREMNCVGRANACSTRVLATEILRMLDELPADPAKTEKAIANLQNRILEAAKDHDRIAPMAERTADTVQRLGSGTCPIANGRNGPTEQENCAKGFFPGFRRFNRYVP